MVTMARSAIEDVVVHTRGAVGADEQDYAREKVAHLGRLAWGPVLHARVHLDLHADPARVRPGLAKAEIDVDGQVVRAHATGATIREAIDAMDARLRDRLERTAHRQAAKHLRHREHAQWRHGDAPATRRPEYPRPAEERAIVRRKSFAVGQLTPEEAALELEQLDHDFFLFTDLRRGADAVIARAEPGVYELSTAAEGPAVEGVDWIRPAPVGPTARTVDEAIELLDLGDGPFVFFLDPTSGRGRVVYRRYDGNYGLIEAADRSG
jgi:ribosome-associated translation inhibitor RaiA